MEQVVREYHGNLVMQRRREVEERRKEAEAEAEKQRKEIDKKHITYL